MPVPVILLGIDGFGRSFNDNCPNINNFLKNGSLIDVNANIPTDSAENWGSIFTGVIPNRHKLKYEELEKPYFSEDYPSIFRIILNKFKNYKVAAYVSWAPIITGMIES